MKMQTICLSTTLPLKTLLQDPQIKGALREREQNYLNNLTWLDSDLDAKNKEEEENKRIQEENISRLHRARLLDEEKRTREAWAEIRSNHLDLLEFLDADSCSEISSIADPTADYDISSMSDFDDDTLSEKVMTPPVPRSKSTDEDILRSLDLKFQKNTRSLSEADDSGWMIKKSAILGYFQDSKCENWKDHRKGFRTMVYTDPKYLEWSATQEKGGPGPGYHLREHGDHRVITAGANWVNWKNEKKEWQCESFHFVKQIYDTMAKRQK